jgi:hypothetical protein
MQITTRDRIGAALGAAFVVLLFVGNGMSTAGTDQSAHPTGEAVLRDAAHMHASGAATLGFVLEVLGFVAFLGFLGFLADVLRRYGGAWRAPAATAFASGLVMLAMKLGSAAPIVALDLDRATLTPQLAQLLNDMNSGAFVVSWLPFAVFVACLGVALRAAGAVGRPTTYIALFLGVAGVALTLVGIRDITNANPMGFLLGMLWLLVVSVRLVVRPATATAALPTPEQRVVVNA